MTSKPRVLVTGATGFAGSHMVDLLLAAGYPVRALVRRTSSLRWVPPGAERVTADVRDAESLRALVDGVGWVFHFGGVTRVRRRVEFFRVNTEGTRQLWEAVEKFGSGLELFLFVSSLAASGPAPAADRPRREEDEPLPISVYGESKLAAERLLEEKPLPGVRLITIRPPAVYGPRDAMILSFFQWARWGLLPLPTPPGSVLSLIHARDLATGCLHLAESGAAGTFHLSDGRYYKWTEIGEVTGRAIGKRLRPMRVPAFLVRLAGEFGELAAKLTGRIPPVNREKVREMLHPYWTCDSAKARARGFAPEVAMEQGIPETVAWYRSQGWL